MIDPAKHIVVLVSSDNCRHKVFVRFLGLNFISWRSRLCIVILYIKNEEFVLFTVVVR